MSRSFLALATCLLLSTGCKTQVEEAVARGNLLRNEGDLSGAILAYENAARLGPDRAVLHLRLGEVLLDARRLDASKHALQRALALESDLLEARLALARVETLSGDSAAAIRNLDQVLALDHDNLYALMSRANLALEAGQVEAAITDYGRAVTLEPANPAARYGHGSALLAHGDRADARLAYEALEKLDPEAPFGAYGLARLAATSKTPASALPLLRETLRRAAARDVQIVADEIRSDHYLKALSGLKAFDIILDTLSSSTRSQVNP